MANARPFSISTLQDLFNDTKNTSIPRTPPYEVFWALLSNPKHSGVPEDSRSPTLGVLGFTPTLGQSGVATNALGHVRNIHGEGDVVYKPPIIGLDKKTLLHLRYFL
jgi:hypothetical protein